jgi:hypothetical protein
MWITKSQYVIFAIKAIGALAVIALSFWAASKLLDRWEGPPTIDEASRIRGEIIEVGDASGLQPLAVTPNITGSWTANGQDKPAGPAPLSGNAYGSFSGNDANTGILMYEGLASKSAVLYLPLVTGPNTDNLEIQINDPRTGKLLFWGRPAIQTKWVLLKFSIPNLLVGRPLQLRFIDNGKGWGQWMAVGVPHEKA